MLNQENVSATQNIEDNLSYINQQQSQEIYQILDQQQENKTSNYQKQMQSEIINKQNKVQFDTYEHQAALQIISKLIQRNYSRFFIRGLTYAYIQSLKKQQKLIIVQQQSIQQNYYYNQQVKQINWPYKQLYLLDRRTPEQQQMFQFVNHCAGMIQSNFRRYITQKRHNLALKKAKKATLSISALVIGWKTYRVYNSKKCYEVRKQIRDIQQQIDIEEEKIEGRDAKKLKTLYKFVDVHSKLFSETFSIYMNTGAWVLDENMKSKIQKNYTKVKNRPQILLTYNNHNSQRGIRQIQKDRIEVQKQNVKNNSNSSTSYNQPENISANASTRFGKLINQFEEKPICAKGAYIFNQTEASTVYNDQAKNNEGESIGEVDPDRNRKNIQKENNKRKMKKRQMYDPRKAIEEQKKRKQQLGRQVGEKFSEQKTVEKQKQKIQKKNQDQREIKRLATHQSIDKSLQKIEKKTHQQKTKIKINGNKQTTPIHRQQNHKKVKSKVNCWSNKQQIQPEWVRSYKARLAEQNQSFALQKRAQKIIEDQDNSNAIQKTQQSKQAQKFSYSWQKRQIEALKTKNNEQQIHRKNSEHNLREQLKMIHERNAVSKKNFHRSIAQLEETYNSSYTQRYQRLIPKLQLLSYARDIEKSSKIPVINNQCQLLAEEFQYVQQSSNQFWSLCSHHQKVFRGFLTQPLQFN